MSDTAAQQVILVRREAGACHVTLNRADKFNALNPDMVEALLALVEECTQDGTRLMSLRGAGRNFSAGFDLGDFEQVSEGDLLLRFVRIEQLLQTVHHAPFATIAFTHGRNFGAGVDLACSCSRRIAAPGASFRMPGLRFGLVLGSRRFAASVGRETAQDILLRSHQFDSDEAQRIGFVHRVAEPGEWDALAAAALQDTLALSAQAVADLRRVTREDTRAQDLADLASSASLPGLKDRLRAYRAAS